MRLFAVVLSIVALLSGCAERVYAPDEAVAAARYQSDEAPYISLMTMVNRANDKGAHSAIIANGSQVALYDPAGTFRHESVLNEMTCFMGNYAAYEGSIRVVPCSRNALCRGTTPLRKS